MKPTTPLLIATLAALFLAGFLLGMMRHNLPSPSPSETADTRPRYAVGDCIRKLDREPWEPGVWAEVVQVGHRHYLVDLKPYKRRSKFSDLAAYTFTYEGMHTLTERTPCPRREWEN